MKFFSDDWGSLKHIVLYGYGTVGKSCLKKMQSDFSVDFIMDRDTEKSGRHISGIPVYAPEDGLAALAGQKIIVMTGGRVYLEISSFLRGRGLEEFKDYCSIEFFITHWYWEAKGMNCVMELHSAITMNCTLKCKHCNMFVPFYERNVTYDIDHLKDDADMLFKYVDYVFCYTLLGGEPFLHAHIGEFIRYLAETYGDKIGTIKIVTNGTLLPGPETIEVLRKYPVWVSISDYTGCVPYGERLGELRRIFDENAVDYTVSGLGKWLAFGFPDNPVCIGEDACASHMRECSPIFHGYNDKKIFYCHVAWSAQKIGRYALQEKDFVDLKRLPFSERHVIAEHCLGEIKVGYVSFCRVCGGCGKDNTNYVPVGEQLKSPGGDA